MRGILTETSRGWFVKEIVSEDRLRTMQSYGDNLDEYPLHPDDVKLILEEREDYPNIWVGSNEIEFEIVNVYVEPPETIHCNRGADVPHAKMIDETHYLLSTKANRKRLQSHSDQMIDRMNDDEEWDNIFHDYQMDNYPPFGGPFTDAVSFEEWLKNKFHPPVRKS